MIKTSNVVFAVVASLAASLTAGCLDAETTDDDLLSEETATADDGGKADAISTVSTFFTARRDTRRCVSPLCGGIWVKRLNQAETKCVDGVWRSECYVPAANYAALDATENEMVYLNDRLAGGAMIVRATLANKTYQSFGNLGVLKVTEAWDAATSGAPTGTFYAASDSGIRCITTPCASIHLAKLNTTTSGNITDLNLTTVSNVSDEAITRAWTQLSEGRILVAGSLASGAGGAVKLTASQFYLEWQRKLEIAGDWSYQRTSTSARYNYTFTGEGTFTSYQQPACAFANPPCLVKIALLEGTYTIARDGSSVALVYTSALRQGETATFTVQGEGTAAKLVGRDFGANLTLKRN